MTKKIFRSIFTIAFAVLLACLLLITGVLYEYFSSLQEGELRIQAELAAQGVQNGGERYFEGLDTAGYRLTWIAADGTVLFDTDAPAETMENHAGRKEFIEAVGTGSGVSSRVSRTLSEKTIYYARLLPDGTVMRAASTHYTAPMLLLGISQPIALIALLAALLAAALASRLSKRIVGPLNDLDLDRPLENDVYKELSPLLTRVEQQQRQIAAQLGDLKRRRDEFAAVTDSMSEGLILLDEKGRILSMNSSAGRIFDAETNCVGRDILTVDRGPEFRALLEKALKGQRGEAVIERNGLEYQLNTSPIISEEKLCGAVLLIFDIMEKLRAERLRREFTANVSHELKTPLQSIMGSAELLRNGIARPEDKDRFLSQIYAESEHLVTLVDDIIRLSGLDEGEQFQKEPVDLFELAKDVALNLKGTAEKKRVTVSVAGGKAEITGVRQLLWEIVWNLCDNGIKYNAEGGKVDVTVSGGAGGAVLTVRDTGIGIPPEHQGRVFERFYRVDKSHSRATGGTGLGLSIVKHAAQYHGAAVELKSEKGKGSVFTVRFPQ